MRLTVAEVRDWLETVATGASLYLAWRWRPRKERRDVTIHAPAATALAVMPTPAILNLAPVYGTSEATLALTTGSDVILDSMAELNPDFPQF